MTINKILDESGTWIDSENDYLFTRETVENLIQIIKVTQREQDFYEYVKVGGNNKEIEDSPLIDSIEE